MKVDLSNRDSHLHFNKKHFLFSLRFPLEDTWMEPTDSEFLFSKATKYEDWQSYAFYMLGKDSQHVSEHVCSMDTLITNLKSHRKHGYTITLLDHSLSKKQAYDLKANWQEQLQLWGIRSGDALTDRMRGEQFKK